MVPFGHDDGLTPIFFDVPTLSRTWQRHTGKGQAEIPPLTVVDLRLVLTRMLTQPGDWRTTAFVPTSSALDAASELARAKGDEPPALL